MRADHALRAATTAWLMNADGVLHGNGKEGSDGAGRFDEGDRMGFLLDLDDGSLRFFKNGVEHGPGYPAGSVVGPVARAVQMFYSSPFACSRSPFFDDGQNAVRLLPGAAWPAGHAP